MKIALMGISGAGKDYFVSHLVKEQNYIRLSFSDQLKKIASQIFDWFEKDYPPELKEKPLNIETELGEKITLSPREIWLKMNFLRDIENDLFVRKLLEEMNSLKRKYEKTIEFGEIPDFNPENIVISDIRTLPEYKMCKERGFKIIRIDAEKTIHNKHKFDEQIFDFEPDYVFKNEFDGIEKFDKFIKNILEKEK